jgi:hypothetical protein
MTISENVEEFLGVPVRDYEYGRRIEDPAGVVYRLRVPWEVHERGSFVEPEASEPVGFVDRVKQLFGASARPAPDSPESESPFAQLFRQFIAGPGAPRVPALIIGDWGGCGAGDSDSSVAVNALVQGRERLPNLRALFLGDIAMEESEISWIQQSDLSPLWDAYPDLEYLQIRGGEHLSLGEMALPKLHTLILETGGLPASVLHEVRAADLPSLEHLELWLGVDDYGGDWTLEDLRPLLDGRLFPALRYLGLCDSEQQDEIAAAVCASPIMDRLRVLDLSMGTLTDEGGSALLACPAVRHLERLDLSYHFLSDDMMAKLSALGIDVDLSDRQEPDEHQGEVYRYVAVSE